jgi:hypothetical protein
VCRHLGILPSYGTRYQWKGAIVTLEGSPEIANLAEETFESLGIRNATVVTGPFHQTLAGALESSNPIDFFFNDGHHDHDAVIQYFNAAMPFLSDGAVVVVDDISWSSGMRKAWVEIEDDERVSASIDLRSIGIALVEGRRSTVKATLGDPTSRRCWTFLLQNGSHARSLLYMDFCSRLTRQQVLPYPVAHVPA